MDASANATVQPAALGCAEERARGGNRPALAAILSSGPAPGIGLRYLSALLLAVAVFAIAAVSSSTLGDDPDAGIGAAPDASGALRVAWVMAGGYAAEAGLASGDLVRPVPVPAGSAGWQAYEVLEGAKAGRTIVLSRRWPPALDLALLLLGLEFLLSALVVHVRAADRSAAARFTALAATVSATLVAFPAVGDGVPWALVWEWFGSKAGMAAFVFFFLTVPVPRWALVRRLLVCAPIPILASYLFVVLARPDLYGLVKVAGYTFMATGTVVSMAAMVWPFVTAAPSSQRRLWPVAVGSAAGAMIYLLASLLPYILFRRYLVPAEVAVLGLGLLPVGFAWAVLRYPVMGISLGSRAILKTVFESISDPIFVVGRDGYIVDASRAGKALLGIAGARRLPEQFQQAINRMETGGGDGNLPRSPVIRSALAGQLVHDAELALRLPSGEVSYFSLEGTPLCGEGGDFAMTILVFRDITTRKLREIAREELERQKDDFLAAVSHDLRTPLTSIKYSVGVVLANQSRDLKPPMRRMLTNIDLAADKMTSQVNDLLELARLQAGKVELHLSLCDIRHLAQTAAAAIEPLTSSRHQSIRTELPDEPCWVLADEARLERAVTNLLTNAHLYGRDGGTILLRLISSHDEVRLGVSDEGPGIPKAEQERIFDRFYRLGRPDSCAGGSGLGLPIARAMVELHGGAISVESELGAGSTFWIKLPFGMAGGTDENPGCG